MKTLKTKYFSVDFESNIEGDVYGLGIGFMKRDEFQCFKYGIAFLFFACTFGISFWRK